MQIIELKVQGDTCFRKDFLVKQWRLWGLEAPILSHSTSKGWLPMARCSH